MEITEVKAVTRSQWVKIRFEHNARGLASPDYGPFEYVQLTYDALRVGPDGDFLAHSNNGDAWTIDNDPQEIEYSDVIIFGCDVSLCSNEAVIGGITLPAYPAAPTLK